MLVYLQKAQWLVDRVVWRGDVSKALMRTKPPSAESKGRRHIPIDELKSASRRWVRQFHYAFALMSVIPLLVCCYLITVKFFTLSILISPNGLYFLLAVILALLGLLAGRQVVKHVIQRLTEANERLERFQATQSEFVDHVAHELRSPLAIVHGALDNLKDGLHGELTPEQTEPVMISRRQVIRLKRVVGDLLDVGEVESGRLQLRQEEMILQDLLRDVTQSCRALSTERGLSLNLDVPEAPIRMQGDRDRLTQAFLNLLMNAIKFTEHGGVSVQLTHNGETSQVDVTDTGRGISAEDLERVFQKFERVGDTNQEGSGLGLPIAKAIVELHHGRIWVESQLGRGSRFIVRLPTQA